MAWYNFWLRKPDTQNSEAQNSEAKNSETQTHRLPSPVSQARIFPEAQSASPFTTHGPQVRRHFYNEAGFQTYASFFAFWDGWITAGHCLTESKYLLPDFADGEVICRPSDLDAATIGCTLPDACPAAPYSGQEVICIGYPAGCRTPEKRTGKVYIERSGAGSWIAHIIDPDEPVVSGMSGGAVFDAASGTPIGIIITRNSPADLNNDRDPDESCDFTALSDVWKAIKDRPLTS